MMIDSTAAASVFTSSPERTHVSSSSSAYLAGLHLSALLSNGYRLNGSRAHGFDCWINNVLGESCGCAKGKSSLCAIDQVDQLGSSMSDQSACFIFETFPKFLGSLGESFQSSVVALSASLALNFSKSLFRLAGITNPIPRCTTVESLASLVLP